MGLIPGVYVGLICCTCCGYRRCHFVEIHVPGSTGVALLVCGSRALVANVGDSRIVLGKRVGRRVVAIDLSRDHKPNLHDEEKRIVAANGRVFEWGVPRVWLKDVDLPGLAVSRSFGDLAAESVDLSCFFPVPRQSRPHFFDILDMPSTSTHISLTWKLTRDLTWDLTWDLP